MTEWLLLGVAVLLVLANALFVAAEFSFITVDRASVERDADGGDSAAAEVLAALKTLSTQLSGAQLGITISSLVVGFIAEPSLATLLRGPLGGLGLDEGATRGVAFATALVVATGVQMVFGELVAKNWAIAEPMRLARWVARPQRTFTAVSGPLITVLNGSANQVLRLMRVEPQEELASARGPQELSSLIGRSRVEGKLDETTARLVSRTIEFGELRASNVMTPRPQVEFLAADRPAADVVEAVARTGFGRFPVVGDSVDDVRGVVHFKHVVGIPPEQRGECTVGEVMVEVLRVPSSQEVDDLLVDLHEHPGQLAVVVDEYGGTAGIVTLEDVIEEIVGEIEDEQDRPDDQRHERAEDGSWLLSGLLRPDEASAAVGLRLPDTDRADTLAGLLVEELGRLPEVGDTVTVAGVDDNAPDTEGIGAPVEVELVVAAVDGQRVERVRLRSRPRPVDGKGGSGGEGEDGRDG